ncbi:phosphoglycolate phosphatase [Rugamonas sp. CCM 8940]|uniref:phosphoglycolate phosphatase n=1 Tax=Rugamonas sp. CCM 8940 TaxID=2765359 RepID=UPI0018F53EE6|nr:phosphoglycolate phosphatase [Rugamonas sp. CCM 8940]MBJ7312810.1 phosphoglycolate phosphatase [Rugamonas sp. CCM 8940]
MTVLAGVRAAIIDLDGTMLDTLPDFQVAVNRMRADFALAPISQQAIGRMIGKGSEHLIHCVLALDYQGAELTRQLAPALASYQRHYLDINGRHSALFPDVVAGLQAMRAQGLRLACVTNKPIAFAKPLLEMKGLAPYFELLYGGDSLPRKKPDPLPLQTVCRDFGLEPATVVAIGDSQNDAQAARAAGCPVLTVPYGYNHGQAIHETDSDGIVTTLLDAANQIRFYN